MVIQVKAEHLKCIFSFHDHNQIWCLTNYKKVHKAWKAPKTFKKLENSKNFQKCSWKLEKLCKA